MHLTSQMKRRRSTTLAALAIGLCAASGARTAAAAQEEPTAQDEERFQPSLFQLYDTQAARATAAQTQEHIAAARWPEAIDGLQTLIEDHDGEVLGATRPKAEGASQPSQTNVHPGAGAWAVSRLFELPTEGRAAYQRRFGDRAAGALERALDAADRGALSSLAQRWPLTEAATSAWWALGDLEAELGHDGDALRAWARAAGFELGRPRVRVEEVEGWEALRGELDAALEGPRAAGVLARIDFAVLLAPGSRAERSSRPTDEATHARGPALDIAADALVAGGIGRTRPSAEEAGEWPRSHTLPYGPFQLSGGASRLFPQRIGDLVIINTSRSVHAIDAFDGSERWRLDESQLGWHRLSHRALGDFNAAVDLRERIVTTAADRGVVVAPVQIPVQFQDSQSFKDLEIIEIIPERRLVALDASTGAPLWDTLPPADWDGDSGTFSERMTVVGPPTIVGTRVLAPLARLRGRIEMHLGCFDLATGEELWSAPLVTGQRSLNMFGRATTEFSAPAPVVSGDTVVVLTQLGLVAAVDLFTGEVLWDTIYEQVDINAPRYYQEGWLDAVWRNAPPVVTGETVLAAPQDGRDLVAIDLTTGALIWSERQERIAERLDIVEFVDRGRRFRRRSRDPGTAALALIGADEDHVLFGGQRVGSLRLPRGIRGGPPFARDWIWPTGDFLLDSSHGLPVLDRGSVFVPDAERLVRLERDTGRIVEEVDGPIGSGQLLVSRGMVFSANGRAVHARFDWLAMVERARAKAESEGATARDAVTLARLLLERAEGMIDQGTRPGSAVDLAREAADAVQRFGAQKTGSDGALASSTAALADQLLRARMVELRAERMRGNVERALTLVDEAAELADGPGDMTEEVALDVALIRYAILRDRATVDERLRALDRAVSLGRGREIAAEAAQPTRRWSATDVFRACIDAARNGGRDPWIDPWSGPITPTTARIRRGDLADGALEAVLSVDAFAALERARIGREISATGERARGESGLAVELDALHALTSGDDATAFGTTLQLYAETRIHALRVLHEGAPEFATIESLAGAALSDALAEAERAGDLSPLDRIPDRFPGSTAARDAIERKDEVVLRRGDPREMARSLSEGRWLPPEWSPTSAGPRQVERLALFAQAMGRGAENVEFEAGLLSALERATGDDASVEIPVLRSEDRTTLADAAEDARQRRDAALDAARVPPPSFDQDAISVAALGGDFEAVATVLHRGAPGEEARPLGIFASDQLLVGVRTGGEGIARWEHRARLDGPFAGGRRARVALSAETLVVAERDRVVGLDPETGTEVWSRSEAGKIVTDLTVSDGVVVATFDGTDPQVPAYVHGFDASLGLDLWSLGPIDTRYSSRVVAGEGVAAFLPISGRTAELHDLYTGHVLAMADTGTVGEDNAAMAWIDGGRLVLPVLQGAQLDAYENAIQAFDLETGEREWRISLDRVRGAKRSLLSIVDMPEAAGSASRVRLAMVEQLDGQRDRRAYMPPYELFRIDEDAGALVLGRHLAVEPDEQAVGVELRRYTRLEAPLLVVMSPSTSGAHVMIRGVRPDLSDAFRVRSERRLVTLGAGKLPPPVIGDGVVALLVRQAIGAAASNTSDVRIQFLDVESGEDLGVRPIGFGGRRQPNWKRLDAFGRTLVIGGAGTGSRTVFMESPR